MGRIKRFSASRHTDRGRAERQISRLNLKYAKLDKRDRALREKARRLDERAKGIWAKQTEVLKKKAAIQEKVMHLTYPEVR